MVAPGESAAPRRRLSRRCQFAVAYEDEHLLVVDKPAGLVVHPARGHRTGTLAQALAGRAAGRRGPLSRGHRAPPGPRHLRAARGGQVRRGAPGAEVAAGGARAAPRVPDARRRAPAGPHRHDRRPDRPPSPRPGADVDRHRRAAGGAHPLRDRAAAARARRCCGSSWTPAAPTRSGSTWRPSITRCAATPSTARPASTGCERQFLHAARLAFAHPVTGEAIDVKVAAARGSGGRAGPGGDRGGGEEVDGGAARPKPPRR